MNRIINEKDVSSTVQDFETLCLYLAENKVVLTANRTLGKNICFDLNSRMAYPLPGAKNTHFMKNYPSINLYFTIALRTGLLAPLEGARQKAVLATTDTFAQYQQLSIYSKYLFIFLAWTKYIDTDALYGDAMNRRYFDTYLIEYTFEQIGKSQEPITVPPSGGYFIEEEKPLQYLMRWCKLLLHHLRDLGLIGYDEQDTVQLKYYRTIVTKLCPTELGAILSTPCQIRRFSWINELEEAFVYDEELEIYEDTFTKNPPGTLGFLEPFIACFPENEINADIINQLLFPQLAAAGDGMIYKFRINLGSGCYREINCAGNHTFEDLHLAIQDAFDFDNDHLYSFFMSGRAWSGRRISSPYCADPPYADEYFIGGAGLSVKQKILYLFDFGDCWKFDITLLSVSKSEDVLKHPVITKTVGEAPQQYYSEDEDWDDDEDDR